MDPSMWLNMFGLETPILEKVLRTIIIYLILLVGLRLGGKRELSQLNPFDLVVLLTISNAVQNAIIGNDNTVIGGIISVATLLIVNYFFIRLVYGNNKIEKVVEGEEVVLIDQGQIQVKAMEQEMISHSELEIAAHKQGYHSLDNIERAILEPEGGISFIGKEPTTADLHHQELMERMNQMSVELGELRAELANRSTH